MNKKRNFTEGPIGGPIFTFVLPMIASSLLQMMYNIADSSAVGRLVGSNELAAVSATGSFSGLLINMFTGIGVGAGVLVARYFGAKDMRRVTRSVHTSMIMSVIVGAVFCVGAMLLHGPIIELYIKEPLYVPIAKRYMGIICMGIPALCIYNFASAVLRSLGDTKTPLIIGAATGLVNVILNYTLILGIEGIGERGAAIATIIAQYLSAISVVVYMFVRQSKPYALRLKSMCFDTTVALGSLRLGIPAGIQSSCLSLSNIVLNSSVTALSPLANGQIAQYANSIVHSVTGISWSVVACYAQAITAYMGQNWGAGKLDRVKRGFRVITLQGVAVLAVVVAAELLASPLICRLFINDSAPVEETIALAVPLLAFVMIPYVLAIVMDLMQGMLRGLGYSTGPMIISLITVVGIRIVWSQLIFPLFTEDYYSIFKLYLCYIISYVVTIAALGVYMALTWRSVKERIEAVNDHQAA
ncbi:MAG: MATE family efflux transporter [Clostridia bacterium]|nr:MATE family efflux transporter [Clostridia bacterium]